jgi:flavodoxin I
MKKKAIIYSFNTRNSAKVAKEIKDAFGNTPIDEINAEDITGEKFLSYDFTILGVPTWFDGELPNYWDEFIPELETLDLKGKKIAIFGNGDQEGYPENFVDGIGIMAEIIESLGATIIGFTPTEGYKFKKSLALRDGKFLGLAIDFENQSNQTSKRIIQWVTELKRELNN